MTKIFSIVLATGALLCVSQIKADTISLAFSEDGAAKTQVASNIGTLTYSGPLNADFTTNFTVGSGTPPLPEPTLDLTNFDLTSGTISGSHTLAIYLTETGISTLSSPTNILNAFAGILSGASSISFADYVDPTNAAYGMAELLSTFTYSGGPANSFNQVASATFTNGSPFSETEVITVAFTGANQGVSGDVSMQGVPEPVTMSLLGGGLALLGIARLRRSGKKA